MNLLYSHHPSLYADITHNQHHKWVKFLKRHESCIILFIQNGQRRLRWVGHHHWQMGDQQHLKDQITRRRHILSMLSLFLRQWQGEMKTMDDFIQAYPHLPGNPLPRVQRSMYPAVDRKRSSFDAIATTRGCGATDPTEPQPVPLQRQDVSHSISKPLLRLMPWSWPRVASSIPVLVC